MRLPRMARRPQKKPQKKPDNAPKPGADEPSTSYRPMGASLTIEEVITLSLLGAVAASPFE